MPCIAKVAVNDATIHFDKLYSYLVPPDFSESLWPGSIVLVPFGRGNHPRMAVVLEVGTEEAPDPRLKSLLAAAPDDAARLALRHQANDEIAAMAERAGAETLKLVLDELSNGMKNAFSRSDA